MESLKNDLEEHPVIIRKKRRLKASEKRTFSDKIQRLLYLSLLLIMLFSITTLYSPWTGMWGSSIGKFLLKTFGGAISIPLFFFIYLLLSKITGRKISNFMRQTTGTISLFVSSSLLMGLINASTRSHPLCLTPGSLGKWLYSIVHGNIGSIGTLFAGIGMIFLTCFFYGFLDLGKEDIRAFIERVSLSIRAYKSLHRKNDRSMEDYGEDLVDLGVTREEEEFLIYSPDLPEESTNQDEQSEIIEEELLEEYATDVEEIEEPLASENKDYEISLHTKTDSGYFSEEEEKEDSEETLSIEPNEESYEETDMDNEEISDESDEIKIDGSKDSFYQNVDEELPKESLSSEILDEEDETWESFPPDIELFGPKETKDKRNNPELLKQKGMDIITALDNFGVEASLENTVEGPTVIQYQIQLAPGIKVNKISNLSKDIAVALAVPSLRVEAPIPNTSYVGIEIPNRKRRSVTLRSMLETSIFQDTDFTLPLPIGYRVDGTPMVIGLEELPHLLVAGTTGSGKSVFVTSCITALCYKRTPAELRLLLIDPKRVEMAIYEKLPHVLAKPITDPQKAIHALGWAVREMERRYDLFARARVRQLSTYNERVIPKDRLPNIVIVVDELADLMFTASKEVEDFICRLAQMARATGIHLILATQRPSVNVVTGLIKANIPARAAFTLPSQTDSRTIINTSGAQQLLGRGDMLFTSTKNPRPVRIQSPFIDEDTSLDVIDSMRKSFGDPQYVELEDQENGRDKGNIHLDDDRLEEAIQMVLDTGIASASRLQRQMRIGFTRAARLVDTMEQMGIVGPPEGSKPREIYVDEERAEEIIAEYFN